MSRGIFFLMVGDLLAAFFCVIIAFLVRLKMLPDAQTPEGSAGMMVFILVMGMSSFFLEMYNQNRKIEKKETAARIVVAITLSFVTLSCLYYIFPEIMYGRGILAISLTLFAVSQFVWHTVYGFVMKYSGFAKRVLIIGTGPLARRMGEVIAETPQNFVLSGYVNCASEPILVPMETVLGNEETLMEAVRREKANKIVVSLSERRGIFPLHDVMSCKLSGIEVVDAPSFYEEVTGKLLIENLTPSWFIFSDGFRVTFVVRVVKRLFDILLASIGILLVLPILPLIALVIKLDSKGPILFRQTRVGEGEKHFTILKFRTMKTDAEKNGAVWAQKNDPRVTRVGDFLRKSRIDEIPQLFNVLRGDMSFVGPRPERPEFIEELKKVIPFYSERHFVKPGVTGWAQVRYPYGASIEDAVEKLRYDLYYIKNLTFTFDFMIILDTIKVVLFRRGGR